MTTTAKGARRTQAADRRPWYERLGRLIRYRLVVPIKRSQHPPEYTARGVAVGIVWALTPTVGIQMPLCLVTWAFTRRALGWDFSVIIAMAWTWITNVVTLLPTYYVFYLTGQLIMGHFGAFAGYRDFVHLWHTNVGADGFGAGATSFWHDLWVYLVALFKGWGVPMLVGCVPWAVAGGWLGYVWSLRFVRSHRAVRHQRRLARLRGEHPHGALDELLHHHRHPHEPRRERGKSG